ncbi:hypothetical protein BDQ17DRAFT_1253107 [Cyathus striatus]|nr:hypothetical protein BDQ17DRAFT_1253107 [Cyathus striatus]
MHSTTSPKQDPSPNISKSGFNTSFRTDAKIWELYLDDAERVAKERVELWKTWLDSLLIFAGLFAGVLASFVVDATDDSNGNVRPYPRQPGLCGRQACGVAA